MNNSKRLRIFLTGVVLGTLVSMVVFQYWQANRDETPAGGTTERSDVVMSTCEMKKGDKLTKECTEIRKEVASQFVPPDTLLSKDLDWHIGKTLAVDIKKGNALRTVDFLPN